MIIKQISVFIENKPGRLWQITKILSDNSIDIRALSIADTTDFGILRLIVNNPEQAEKALKEQGVTVSITNVIAVALADKPGGLVAVLECLNNSSIAVEYTYAFITRSKEDAYVILKVEDVEKAQKILVENNIKLLSMDEISKM